MLLAELFNEEREDAPKTKAWYPATQRDKARKGPLADPTGVVGADAWAKTVPGIRDSQKSLGAMLDKKVLAQLAKDAKDQVARKGTDNITIDTHQDVIAPDPDKWNPNVGLPGAFGAGGNQGENPAGGKLNAPGPLIPGDKVVDDPARKETPTAIDFDALVPQWGRGDSHMLKFKEARGMYVKNIQQQLTDLGYDPKGVDGKMGKNTRAAIAAYNKDHPDKPLIVGSATYKGTDGKMHSLASKKDIKAAGVTSLRDLMNLGYGLTRRDKSKGEKVSSSALAQWDIQARPTHSKSQKHDDLTKAIDQGRGREN